jgi:hypothetical protein
MQAFDRVYAIHCAACMVDEIVSLASQLPAPRQQVDSYPHTNVFTKSVCVVQELSTLKLEGFPDCSMAFVPKIGRLYFCSSTAAVPRRPTPITYMSFANSKRNPILRGLHPVSQPSEFSEHTDFSAAKLDR